MGPREQSHSIQFNQPRSDGAYTMDLAVLPQARVACTPARRDVCEAAFPSSPPGSGQVAGPALPRGAASSLPLCVTCGEWS